MQTAEWLRCRQEILGGSGVPFSFRCGGALVDGQHMPLGAKAIRLEHGRTLFPETDGVEWSPRVRNAGATDTPLLSELCSLDLALPPAADGQRLAIHAIRGCANGAAPFAAEQIEPAQGTTWRINGWGGKTGEFLPFACLDLGGRGLLCGLGWPGRWNLAVAHRADGSVRLTGGLWRADLALHPGEEIPLPDVLLMFWEGDHEAAHNRFRQHILRRHTPACNGQPVPDLVACATWGGMKTHNHLRLIETLRQHQAPFDCYWMDAGWYGAEHATDEYQNLKSEDWFFHVGDWRPNTAVHPHGLKPVSDAAHAAGMKFLLWFEVERAIEASPWYIEHPEWYFGTRNTNELAGRICHWRCFNFGHPGARQAMTERIASLIAEIGIDVFRQDCNFCPGSSWDAADVPGRVGISEIRYVEGLLAFWDELRQRFPHLVLDLVQRRDLATISRAMDLSRADHEFMPHTEGFSSQMALDGLARWTPLSGTGVPIRPGKDYDALSGISSSSMTSIFPAISDVPIRPETPADYPWDWLRRILETNRRARPFFRGDFYPLLTNSVSNQQWAAMQFHRPDLKAGMVLVYRRPESPLAAASFRLRGLAEGCACEVESAAGGSLRMQDSTLQVTFAEAPAVAVAFYRACAQ